MPAASQATSCYSFATPFKSPDANVSMQTSSLGFSACTWCGFLPREILVRSVSRSALAALCPSRTRRRSARVPNPNRRRDFHIVIVETTIPSRSRCKLRRLGPQIAHVNGETTIPSQAAPAAQSVMRFDADAVHPFYKMQVASQWW